MCNDNFHKKIAKQSIDLFNSLPKTGKPTNNEWTVLSTIVKKKDESLEVVALATGSKCIGKSKMSPEGNVLNDSHAEVLCRRAFLRYLYSEMSKEESSVLKLKDGKFVVGDGITFHFFTTCTPCGDASIFEKNSDDCGEILCEEIPSKKIKLDGGDINRTGAKCLPDDDKEDPLGAGKNYHVTGAVRTKPGRGDPTLSMSCSDKLAKWCYLGIQGSLLSLLLRYPIYLKTFTICSETFCTNALNRALYDRFPNVDLIDPYCQMRMESALVKECFSFSKTSEKRPCPSSIIFSNVEQRKVEVAVGGVKQGVPKKHLKTNKSRVAVCKVELMELFLKLAEKHHVLNDVQLKGTYGEIKRSSSNYKQNWDMIKNKCFKIWTRKSEELESFYVT